MATPIEDAAPTELAAANLRPRGRVHPSPSQWRDQVLYFLLPDRFSDGREASRPLFDRAAPAQHAAPDPATWREAGKGWQGGTLAGLTSKLDYLQGLGVTALWVGPVWRQRAELDTYHGYAIQHFLDVDPRLGTRQDLRDLVDAAHERGMYVLLDVVFNHSGNNFFYEQDGAPVPSLPYRYAPPYPVHGWRSATGQSIRGIGGIADGVWPREFQELAWYTRAGQIGTFDPAPGEDPLDPNAEFRRGDFFDLKDLDHTTRDDVLSAVIRVYQYWIALSDCDGFRLDTVKHVSFEAARSFAGAIREYTYAIGKENFLLLGEVTGGGEMERDYLDVFGRNLDAVLDIGDPAMRLASLAKGFGSPSDFFGQFYGHDILGSHRETGRYHVSILDDHDMVGRPSKSRFAAHDALPTAPLQVAHAVGVQLTTLGIPCIYYGTEQAFDGTEDRDERPPGQRDFEDRYIRESMFGGTFGAFQTAGCHFFDTGHPTYRRIAAIARVRRGPGRVGLALRRGRQYPRETSFLGRPFGLPGAGELVAWSRILFDQEVLVVLNTHGVEGRGADVTVHGPFHPAGSTMRFLYRGDWSDAELAAPPDQRVPVTTAADGRSVVRVDLPPAGMAILA